MEETFSYIQGMVIGGCNLCNNYMILNVRIIYANDTEMLATYEEVLQSM